MTTIDLYGTKSNINKIKISGHTEYAELGSDIVCSAISTLAFSVINYLCENKNFKYSIDDETTEIELSMIQDDKDIQEFFQYLKISYQNLQKEYPKNILVRSNND